jgi:hypothetical protein
MRSCRAIEGCPPVAGHRDSNDVLLRALLEAPELALAGHTRPKQPDRLVVSIREPDLALLDARKPTMPGP